MLRISIDGACRRNGKPDCVSSGGVFIQQYDNGIVVATDTRSNYEYKSTNQRGELLALLTALDYVHTSGKDTQIITDSEYIFNAMTKNWYSTWAHNFWKTSLGEPVKNADIWQEINKAKLRCDFSGIDVTFYHIKGHVIPFGKVTAETLLKRDATGLLLRNAIYQKYDSIISTKTDMVGIAQELSIKNNGFAMSEETLRDFVVSNIVADAIATSVVEAADRIK